VDLIHKLFWTVLNSRCVIDHVKVLRLIWSFWCYEFNRRQSGSVIFGRRSKIDCAAGFKSVFHTNVILSFKILRQKTLYREQRNTFQKLGQATVDALVVYCGAWSLSIGVRCLPSGRSQVRIPFSGASILWAYEVFPLFENMNGKSLTKFKMTLFPKKLSLSAQISDDFLVIDY